VPGVRRHQRLPFLVPDEIRQQVSAAAAALAAGSKTASRLNPDGTVAVGLADVMTLFGALRDAAEWRRYRATTWCAECSWAPDNVCAGCAGDLDLADSYAALGRALGDDR